MKPLTCFALVALLALISLPAAAQSGAWTSVASVGALDPTQDPLYTTTSTDLAFRSNQTGTITARYNVTNTYGGGVSDTPPWTTLEMTYTDNSASGFINAMLVEVDPCTNNGRLICFLSSVDVSSPSCTTCTFPSNSINFGTKLYYVEVNISRTSTAAIEILKGLRIY